MIILDPCHPGRKKIIPFRKSTYFAYELYFLLHNASASLTTGVFQYLILYIGIPHNTASDQKSHFTAKTVTDVHETCWSHHVPHHPEAMVLMEWHNVPLKK